MWKQWYPLIILKGILAHFKFNFRRKSGSRFPVPTTQTNVVAATPGVFCSANLRGLPEQFRRKLEVSQVKLYTIVREERNENIGTSKILITLLMNT